MVVQSPSKIKTVAQAMQSGRRLAVAASKDTYIKYVFKGEVFTAQKLDPVNFSSYHLNIIRTATLTDSRELVFANPAWHSVWLGAGEEKTVYLVVDDQQNAFAIELLVKDGYLYGRLTEGYYLTEMTLPKIAGLKRVPSACLSLAYSGEIKVREFIYGETIADISLKSSCKKGNPLFGLIDMLSKKWARFASFPRRVDIVRTFRDAHDANIMIELVPLHNPQHKKHYAIPMPFLTEDGKLRLFYYRVTPIDVRAGKA
jgi:hypothetical protein